MNKKIKQLPIFLLILLLGIYIGLELNGVLNFSEDQKQIKKFGDILKYTEDNYIDSVNSKTLVEDAIKGMFSKLDPHTVYISASEQQTSEEEFRGNFDGIGIEFQIINDTIVVVSPITGGPSESVGIISGDRIIKIYGKNCTGISNEQVIKQLRGKKGTQVEITIYRPSNKKILNYKITRDTINLYSVDVALMMNENIGYVNLTRFSETSTKEIINALQKLSKKGMKKLVLDLRNNPGGYLNQAFNIADLFIDGNKVIVFTKGRTKEYDEKYSAEKSYPYEKIPLVVLINRGSASASEIVAGAVQDWDRGLIVGETSFGKGLVQAPIEFADKSAVRITIAKYYTPSGRAIQRDYKDKKKYYEEIMIRDESESNNVGHSAEKDSSKPVYKTKYGRTVYGGGGITPDYIIEQEKATDYSIELRKNNIYYQYIRAYMDRNGDAIRKLYIKDLKKFITEFYLSENGMNDFVKFASSHGVKYDAQDYSKDKEIIRIRLEAFIARDLFKDDGWYSRILLADKQFQKAAQLFEEAEKLAGFNKKN